MEVQSNGSVKPPVQDGVVEGVKYSGWISRFVPGGWFRKRWVKNWCVLMDDRIFLYDSQCVRCGEPEAKELKKAPNSFLLEMKSSYAPARKKNKKDLQKLPQELFNAENKTEKIRWLEKLNEAIAAAAQAEKTNLDHVTKTRPKPRAVQRRPPSRHHIRQLATQSQLLPGDVGFDISPEIETEDALDATSSIKVHVSTTALMPPKLKVTSELKNKEDEKKEDDFDHCTDKSDDKPVPSPRRRTTLTHSADELKEVKTSSRPHSPIPPATPSKSLKPKLVCSTDDVCKNDGDQTPGSSELGTSITVLPHVLSLQFPGLKPTAAPRSTRSLDRRDLFEQAKARSASNPPASKQTENVDSKAMFIKAQALKLPEFTETDSVLVGKRGKSRSMTLLDRFEELPPPPVPPPSQSVSDIELSSDNIRAKKKKKLRKKQSSSNPNTTDEDE